jgi:SAM-dependent methyltransferase
MACDVQFADPLEEPGQSFYETHSRYTGPELFYTTPRALNWDQRWFLRDRPRRGGALLDVGCGTGYFLAAARQAGYRVSGLDLSRPQLELARRLFGLTDLYPTTLAEYARSRAAGSLDVVTAFQVLEHVADPVGFIKDARRVLVPGGYLVVGVPNWRVWSIFREWLDHPPHHLTRWSRMSLRKALELGGFQVLELREHRSAYSFFLRYLRLGLLRTAMQRFSSPTESAPTPNVTVLALSVAKVRVLQFLDIPAQALLNAIHAPGIILYALTRARE